jgi:hypothetical protein
MKQMYNLVTQRCSPDWLRTRAAQFAACELCLGDLLYVSVLQPVLVADIHNTEIV